MRSWTRIVLLGTISACGSSEADVKHDFAKVVEASNACMTANDCEIVSPGCPLGCAVPVNREHVARVQSRAAELIEDYERSGVSCAYSCRGGEGTTCRENRCELVEPDAQADAGG